MTELEILTEEEIKDQRVALVLGAAFPQIRDPRLKVRSLTDECKGRLNRCFDDAEGHGYAVDSQRAQEVWLEHVRNPDA